jgi:hypothetical protein
MQGRSSTALDCRELVGAIHIHSRFSDGTKCIKDIARIANEVGLDFLMVSDHMTLESLHQGLEGFYGKTAVLIGYEINDPDDKNHYLAFGLDEVLPSEIKAEEYVRLVKQKGGLGIIAHPDEVRSRLVKYPCYPWTDWHVDGYDGIEIWNHMSEWMESLSHWNILKMAVTPRRALKSPTGRILKMWDEINQRRKVVGVGSIDVHAYPYRLGPLRITIFPYKVQLKAIRTHLLLSEPVPEDFGSLKEAIFHSLRECNVFISNYRWGDARGFEFFSINDSGKAICGDKMPWTDDTTLVVKLPNRAKINIVHNNQPIFSGEGEEFEIKALRSGLYRVEAFINKKGWIYSNHIRLT